MEDRAIKKVQDEQETQFPLYVNYLFVWTELLYLLGKAEEGCSIVIWEKIFP